MSTVSPSQPSSSSSSSVVGFGTNEWLVEEMYQQFLADPASVDQAWHEFFADYRPGSPVTDTADRAGGTADAGSSPEPVVPAVTSYDSPAPADEVTPDVTETSSTPSAPAAARPAGSADLPDQAAAEGSATRPSSPAVTPGAAAPTSRATTVDARTEDTVAAKPAERAAQARPAGKAQPAAAKAPVAAAVDRKSVV